MTPYATHLAAVPHMYKITEAEYSIIAGQLETNLSFGCWGLCV